MNLDENTLVAVPMGVWLQAKRTIGKLPIEDHVELWIALNQCKPLTTTPPQSQSIAPPANGSTPAPTSLAKKKSIPA